MTPPDFEAQARVIGVRLHLGAAEVAIVLDALRATALDAGDRVWVAWRDHEDCPTCDGEGAVPFAGTCVGDGSDSCEDCYGEGVISTEALLGIERRRR